MISKDLLIEYVQKKRVHFFKHLVYSVKIINSLTLNLTRKNAFEILIFDRNDDTTLMMMVMRKQVWCFFSEKKTFFLLLNLP